MPDFGDLMEVVAGMFQSPAMRKQLRDQNLLETLADEEVGLEYGGVRTPQGQPRIKVTGSEWYPPRSVPSAIFEKAPGRDKSYQDIIGGTHGLSDLPAEDVSDIYEKVRQFDRESTEGLEDLGPGFGNLMIEPALRDDPTSSRILQELVAGLTAPIEGAGQANVEAVAAKGTAPFKIQKAGFGGSEPQDENLLRYLSKRGLLK